MGLAGAGEPGDALPPDWLYVLDDAFFSGEPVTTIADASIASRMTGNAMRWDVADLTQPCNDVLPDGYFDAVLDKVS